MIDGQPTTTPLGSTLSITRAENFGTRLMGLLGRSSLDNAHGLYFNQCNAVHTWGMRFPIDLVYLDNQGTVLDVVHELKPWRFNRHAKAQAVLELNAGAATQHHITPGVTLCLN